MMKANELMIGDWVQGYLPDTYCKIYGIFNEYKVAVYGRGVYMELPIEDLQPIPITPGILEKNGFYFNGIDKHNTMSINIDYGKWSYENEDGFDVIGDWHDIKFVHQLQQAMRLAGIGKEIEFYED